MTVGARKRCAVVTNFSPQQPGFLDFSYRVRSLAAEFDVLLISNLDLSVHSEFAIDGVKHRQIHNDGSNQLAWLLFLWRCLGAIRSEAFDLLVLLHSTVAPLAFAKPALNCATVVYWNEHPTHVAPPCPWSSPVRALVRSGIRQLMFAGARAADLVLPIGEAHQQDLLAARCRPDRVRLNYMGVGDDFRPNAPQAAGLTAPPLRVVYTGTISVDRGRDVMLEAMHLLQSTPETKDRVQLTLIGARPDQLAYCSQRIEALQLGNSVKMVGRIPGKDIPHHLRQAQIGLCLWEDSIWYRFNPPTKLFEYLVVGLPVLASRIRTHTAYISEGCNGFVFDYSAEGLAQALRRIVLSPPDWAQLNRQTYDSGAPFLWSVQQKTFMQAMRGLTHDAHAAAV